MLTKKAAEAAKLIETLNAQIAEAKKAEEENRTKSVKRGNDLIKECMEYLKSPSLLQMTEKELLRDMQAWVLARMPIEAEKNKRIPEGRKSGGKREDLKGLSEAIKEAVKTLAKNATKEEIIKTVTAKGYPEKDVKQRLYDAAYTGAGYKGAFLAKDEKGVYSLIVK